MNLKGYLTIMTIMTLACWAVFAYVIWIIDPFETNEIGFALFYATLFLSLLGTASIVGFLIRFVGMKRELAFRLVKDAFRQSFLFSILIVISLYLLTKNLFTWLNLFYLIASLSILEFVLLGYEKPIKTE